jgi:hypothetical protein
MTHKEFYIWLEGFMTNRDWTVIKQSDIEIIQGKMKKVKDEPKLGVAEPYRVPIPVNPFPIKDDPFKPPYEVYCGTNKQDDNSDCPPKNVI